MLFLTEERADADLAAVIVDQCANLADDILQLRLVQRKGFQLPSLET